jgi:hypothetical protein
MDELRYIMKLLQTQVQQIHQENVLHDHSDKELKDSQPLSQQIIKISHMSKLSSGL